MCRDRIAAGFSVILIELFRTIINQGVVFIAFMKIIIKNE